MKRQIKGRLAALMAVLLMLTLWAAPAERAFAGELTKTEAAFAAEPAALSGAEEAETAEPAALSGAEEAETAEPATLSGAGEAETAEPATLSGAGEAAAVAKKPAFAEKNAAAGDGVQTPEVVFDEESDPAAGGGASEGKVYQFEATYVNPYYAKPGEALYTETEPVLVRGGEALAGEVTYQSDKKECAKDIRDAMKKREGKVVVGLRLKDSSEISPASKEMSELAMAHTGKPTEGDYLLWHYGGYRVSMIYYSSGGFYFVTYTYSIEYYTTAVQEEAVDNAVEDFQKTYMEEGMTAYEKVKTIHDFIMATVHYDNEGLSDPNDTLKHTAYAAIVKQLAVCQGYASLFYRLCLTNGIDCRYISGIGDGGAHGWNIVRIDGLYYNIDNTWDENTQTYDWFLKADKDFTDHARDAEYASAEFYEAYPMGTGDYDLNGAPSVAAHSLVLDGRIGVNFYLYIPDGNLPGSYLTFEQNEKTLDVETPIPLADGRYKFTYLVNSVCMADPITATLHYGEGGILTDSYSVVGYIEAIRADRAAFSDETIALADAIYDYGYYAQTLPNAAGAFTVPLALQPGFDYTLIDPEELDYDIATDLTTEVKKVSFSLTLDSETMINVYVTLQEGASLNPKAQFAVSEDGNEAQLSVKEMEDGRWRLRIPNIPAHELASRFTITVHTDAGDSHVQLSALSYVKAALSSATMLDETKNTCAALLRYYERAVDYRDSLQAA